MKTSFHAFAAAVLFLACAAARAGTVTVLPGHATVDGKTIGAYTADWWNWAASFPSPGDPFSDKTGATATLHQSGPVFFVAGITSAKSPGAVSRTFNVPGDKYVLFPLLNFIVANGADPGFSSTRQEATGITTGTAKPQNLFARLDGVNVPNLGSHREPSPVNFAFTAVANNAFGAAPGTFHDANSDGYWLMLAPLGSGNHTLHFGGTAQAYTAPGGVVKVSPFTVNVTDHVNSGTSSAVPLPTAVWPALGMMTLLGAVGLRKCRVRRAG